MNDEKHTCQLQKDGLSNRNQKIQKEDVSEYHKKTTNIVVMLKNVHIRRGANQKLHKHLAYFYGGLLFNLQIM